VTTPAGSQSRAVWAFWIAAALAAVGGIAPLVVGGGTNRITGVAFPFAVAAIAFGACAVLYRQQGRPIITLLYVVAGIAIVYGILSMISVPLQLAVVGTCPPSPATCPVGNERGLTGGESSGFGFATGIGIVAIVTGFYGLTVLYRSLRTAPPASPPVRRIAPVSGRTPIEDEPAPVTPSQERDLELPTSTRRLPPKPPLDSPPAGNDRG
jgi:hypothetical protein